MPEFTADDLEISARRYLRDVLAKSERPHVNELAARIGMATADFSDLFLREVGERPSEYLKREQIACAEELLVSTDRSMNQIAYECGFPRRRSFFRTFKRMVGMTPGEYRAANHKPD